MGMAHCLKNTGLEMKGIGNKAGERTILIIQEKDNDTLMLGWEWGRGKSWQRHFRYRDFKEEGEVAKNVIVFINFCSYYYYFVATNINRCLNDKIGEGCFCCYFFENFRQGGDNVSNYGTEEFELPSPEMSSKPQER